MHASGSSKKASERLLAVRQRPTAFNSNEQLGSGQTNHIDWLNRASAELFSYLGFFHSPSRPAHQAPMLSCSEALFRLRLFNLTTSFTYALRS